MKTKRFFMCLFVGTLILSFLNCSNGIDMQTTPGESVIKYVEYQGGVYALPLTPYEYRYLQTDVTIPETVLNYDSLEDVRFVPNKTVNLADVMEDTAIQIEGNAAIIINTSIIKMFENMDENTVNLYFKNSKNRNALIASLRVASMLLLNSNDIGARNIIVNDIMNFIELNASNENSKIELLTLMEINIYSIDNQNIFIYFSSSIPSGPEYPIIQWGSESSFVQSTVVGSSSELSK